MNWRFRPASVSVSGSFEIPHALDQEEQWSRQFVVVAFVREAVDASEDSRRSAAGLARPGRVASAARH